MILPVPYRSQLAADAGYGKGDCGPSTFAMVLYALKVYITVDALGKILGKKQNYTIAEMRELQLLAKEFRVALQYQGRMTYPQVTAHIEARRPIIALVWYPNMPNKFDPNYRNGHFVTIIGTEGSSTIIYHDPYYREQGGATLRARWTDFDRAWSAVGMGAFNVPRQGLVAPAIPTATPVVAVDLKTVKDARWWSEESVRQEEQGNHARARDIMLNEVLPRLYQVEGMLVG